MMKLETIVKRVEQECGENVVDILKMTVLAFIESNWENIRVGTNYDEVIKWAALMRELRPAYVELKEKQREYDRLNGDMGAEADEEIIPDYSEEMRQEENTVLECLKGKEKISVVEDPNPPSSEQEDELRTSSTTTVSSDTKLDAYVFRRDQVKKDFLPRRSTPLTRTPGHYFILLTPRLSMKPEVEGVPAASAPSQNITINNLHNYVIANADQDEAFKGWPDGEERKKPGGHDAWKTPCDVAISWFVELGYLVRLNKNAGSTYERTAKPLDQAELVAKLKAEGYSDTGQYLPE